MENKRTGVLSGVGFYVTLVICLLAAGIGGYFLLFGGQETAQEEDAPQTAVTAKAPEIPEEQEPVEAVSPAELPFDEVFSVSAKTGQGLDALRQALAEKFSGGAPCDGSILTNPRQAGAVRCAHAALERALAGLQAQMTPDAVLLDVEAAMQAIGELTGKTIREDITQRIFSRFCVGK